MLENSIVKAFSYKYHFVQSIRLGDKLNIKGISFLEIKCQSMHRLINFYIRMKEDIKARKKDVLDMLKIDTHFVTDSEKRDRYIQIKVHMKTVNERFNIYKKYNAELIRICDHEGIKQLMDNLYEILDESNYMTCLFDSIFE